MLQTNRETKTEMGRLDKNDDGDRNEAKRVGPRNQRWKGYAGKSRKAQNR